MTSMDHHDVEVLSDVKWTTNRDQRATCLLFTPGKNTLVNSAGSSRHKTQSKANRCSWS